MSVASSAPRGDATASPSDHSSRLLCLDLSFTPDPAALVARLGLEHYPEEADDFLALLDEARRVARPRAAFFRTAVVRLDQASRRVEMAGTVFTGELLAARLSRASAVWPHLVTCGRELEKFVDALSSPLHRFWGESILVEALYGACRAVERQIATLCNAARLVYMGPGALPGWAIEEQLPLFAVLSGAADFCGVELTSHMVMVPAKSLSGLYVAQSDGWTPCGGCDGRRCGDGCGSCACRGGESASSSPSQVR